MQYLGPKRWKPVHDLILLYFLAGATNRLIAERVGRTPEYVSLLLSCPQAQVRIIKMKKEMRDKFEDTMAERIVGLADASLDNIARTVATPANPESAFKRHQDMVGFKLLEMAGYTRDGSGVVGNNRDDKTPMTEEQADRMLTLMTKADKAREVEDAVFSVEAAKPSEDEEDVKRLNA